MNGPTWEDFERDAERADFEYDKMREDRMLNPDKYKVSAAPICEHPHDIADGGVSAAKFNEFTKRLREAKA